jgi:hypothetical protein
MEVIDFQHKVVRVAIAVGLALDNLDTVVDPIHLSGGVHCDKATDYDDLYGGV